MIAHWYTCHCPVILFKGFSCFLFHLFAISSKISYPRKHWRAFTSFVVQCQVPRRGLLNSSRTLSCQVIDIPTSLAILFIVFGDNIHRNIWRKGDRNLWNKITGQWPVCQSRRWLSLINNVYFHRTRWSVENMNCFFNHIWCLSSQEN